MEFDSFNFNSGTNEHFFQFCGVLIEDNVESLSGGDVRSAFMELFHGFLAVPLILFSSEKTAHAAASFISMDSSYAHKCLNWTS